MARTRWPSDLGTPASCPGQADQTGSAGGRQKTWDPADRSSRRTARGGVSRIGGQAGTQAPDPTPTPPQNLGSRAGSTIHILPADSARRPFVLTMRSNGRRSLHYLRRVDSDGIRDDGLAAARSTRYTRLVIEPGVSKTSSPSASRAVARVISP